MADYTVTSLQSELADREAIRNCLIRYCRGADRGDEELLRSAYWPGAIDDHVMFVGTAEEFIPFALRSPETMDQTAHLIGNILIEMDGNAAANTETYLQAFHRLKGDSAPRDVIVGGRYVDRFEKREDEWRIASRVVIIDWFREYPDSGDWSGKPLGMDTKPGARKPDDRSYKLMKRTAGDTFGS